MKERHLLELTHLTRLISS